MIKLGFHMSIAGSVANAPRSAIASGYNAFQMFVTSSRSWKHSEIRAADSNEFRRLVSGGGLAAYAHIPYLCNPSSTNKEMHGKSVHMLVDNMRNCEQLGVQYLVVHIGSHLGKGLKYGIANTSKALESGLASSGKVMVLLENTAGYTNSVGSKFDEIAEIIDGVGSKRVGMCLDTCHTFAAGYDLRTDSSVAGVMDELDSTVGLGKVKLVHLNDAKYGLGSHLDRHWHLGKGYIGRGGFLALFRNGALNRCGFIMETPVISAGDEKMNYDFASSVIREAGLEV
jgi:deoxyribonuclease-4